MTKETEEEVLALFDYEWHDAKSETNLEKHDVNFNKAKDLFIKNYKTTVQYPDYRPEDNEGRHRIILLDLESKRAYKLVFTIRDTTIRFISCSRIRDGSQLGFAKQNWKKKGFI
jgi:uncharacterized DUF497 family protein